MDYFSDKSLKSQEEQIGDFCVSPEAAGVFEDEESFEELPVPSVRQFLAQSENETDTYPDFPSKQQGSGGTTDMGEVKAAELDETEERHCAEHEDVEAERKAEWEAKQEQKKKMEQEQLKRLDAMSDDEVFEAASKRICADVEKITRRNMKECVAEYIQTCCLEDPAFARLTMYPHKTMLHCFQYINRKAWDYVQDELKINGIHPGSGQQGYGCDIPDDLCYQWAEEYFRDPNAKEDQEQEEKFVSKPYSGKNSAKVIKKKKTDNETAGKKKAETKLKLEKSSTCEGQMSFL